MVAGKTKGSRGKQLHSLQLWGKACGSFLPLDTGKYHWVAAARQDEQAPALRHGGMGSGGWGLGAEQGYKRSSRKSTTHGHTDNWPGKGWEETTPTNPQLCFTKELGALGQEPSWPEENSRRERYFLSASPPTLEQWESEKGKNVENESKTVFLPSLP